MTPAQIEKIERLRNLGYEKVPQAAPHGAPPRLGAPTKMEHPDSGTVVVLASGKVVRETDDGSLEEVVV